MREPLTAETLASMRARVDAYDGPDRYTATVDGIDYDGHWRRDIRRLLDEVERLRDELEVRDRTSQYASATIKTQRAEIDRLARERTEADALRAEAFRHAADRDAYVTKTLDRYNALCGANIGLHTANESLKRQADAVTTERDALAAKVAVIDRIIEPRGPGWKRLSERYPEHFKRVSAEEHARRNGWDEGVSLMSDRIKAVLDGETPALESPRESLSERGRAAHFERCPDCGGRLSAGESCEGGELVERYVHCGECEWLGSETPREPAYEALRAAMTAPDGSHRYLSTGCLHGRHDHCRSTANVAGGPKQPHCCKFCEARCRCWCHDTTTEETTDA